MILIDSRTGSKELLPYIQQIGVPTQLGTLEFGDLCFEGNGPKGKITIGIERKSLHDMLNCIDDSRYSAFQRPGMIQMYDKSFLIVEGVWKPADGTAMGFLFEGFNGGSWSYCRYRSSKVMYAKLYRYLLSISLSGVIVLHARNLFETAYNCCEVFHYFQKQWNNHTSLIETQKIHLPSLEAKPPLVRRWAADLSDVGVKFSLEAQRLFKTPIAMAMAQEEEWMRIKGIGAKTAMSIIREIWGTK